MKEQLNTVDKAFYDIVKAAESALKDRRWHENQQKKVKAIERLLKRIHAHVAWAQMH